MKEKGNSTGYRNQLCLYLYLIQKKKKIDFFGLLTHINPQRWRIEEDKENYGFYTEKRNSPDPRSRSKVQR